MKTSYFSPDALEFVRLLAKHNVRYVIVGGVAVIYYGSARLTGDIDFFYDVAIENVTQLYAALEEFWQGSIPGIKSREDLTGDDVIIQFGNIPNRIDLITSVDAVTFEDVWAHRLEEKITIDNTEYPIYFINLKHLIKNKESVKRGKDLDDLKFLKKLKL